jgi:hypothetical protein
MQTAGTTRLTIARLLAVPVLLLGLSACRDSTGIDDDHAEFSRVELQTRGQASALLATWTSAQGWRNATGQSITELPTPVDQQGTGLVPLRAGGANASLTVRYFDKAGAQIPMATAARQTEQPRDRTCTEDEARYVPIQTTTNVIAWPNRRHPSNPTGPFHWADGPSGPVALFHCDHVHIYPRSAGTVDLTFVLWHDNHSDGETTPIRVRVEPAN